MRMGSIFARGSCRALKWMALFGVVFALGAGSALAQITISDPKTVNEGGRAAFIVTAKVKVLAADLATTVAITGTAEAEDDTAVVTNTGGVAKPTEAETADFTVALSPLTLQVPKGPAAGSDPALHTLTGTLYMLTGTDHDAEDEAVSVAFSVASTTVKGHNDVNLAAPTPNTRSITIKDAQSQAFKWVNLSANPREGTPATVTLMADPDPDDLIWNTGLNVNTAGYELTPGTIAVTKDDPTGTVTAVDESAPEITITPAASDQNRTDDTILLRALLTGTVNDLPGLEPLPIKFADIHKLPAADKITAKAYMDDGKGKKTTDEAMSVMEGGDPVHVTVTVDRETAGYPSGEALIVTPTAASSGQGLDFRLDPVSFEIASGMGKKSADFKLYALADDDVGAEDLVLNLVTKGKKPSNGAGESTGTFTIAIGDETTPLLEPKPDAEVMATVTAKRTAAAGGDKLWTPGEMFSIMTSDLFSSSNPVGLSASSSSPSVGASVAGDTITLTAMSVGTATIKIIGSVDAPSVTTQTISNLATVEFDVTVDELPLAITLSTPSVEELNLTEGKSVMVTATANRAVTMDTMVELFATGGTASPSDYTVDPNPIQIMSGEMTGTTMVMAMDDDMAETSETLTLEGRVGSMKTNALTFTIWDAAVPALPVIAQLLLAAFLALGGYRRYLRR